MPKPTGAMQVTAGRRHAPSAAPMSCAVSLGGERLAYGVGGGSRDSHIYNGFVTGSESLV